MQLSFVVSRSKGKVLIEILGPRLGNHGEYRFAPDVALYLARQITMAAMAPEQKLVHNVAVMDIEPEG